MKAAEPGWIAPKHFDDLAKSGISASAQLCGVYSASAEEVKALLGFGTGGTGLVFPYTDDYVRVRIDNPGPDGKRYRAPKGSTNRLYVRGLRDTSVLDDVGTTLYITEGEKKAIKACFDGFPTVALPGVWSWKRKLHGQSLPIADLDRIEWKGRTVVLVFDSDAADKPPVAWAEHALAIELQTRGAKVYVIRLPEGPRGEKYGLDDYLHLVGRAAFLGLPMRSLVEADGEAPTFLRMDDLVAAYLDEAMSPVARLHMGLPGLDAHLRGLAPGEVLTILGRSGVGKTAIGLNLVDTMTTPAAVPTLIFSLEMSGTQLFERAVAMANDLPGHSVESGARLQNAAILDAIFSTARRLSHVVMVDRPCSLSQVDKLLEAANRASLWPTPLRLVVIDYLGMLTPDRFGKAYEVVSETAREIKRIAKRHRVSIVLLCQISREGGSGGTPVTIQMARDSGVIEESADYILGAWRPELDDSLTPDERPLYAGELKVRLLKVRNGPAGATVALRMSPTLRIGDKEA